MSVLVGKQAPDFTASFVMPDKTVTQQSLADFRGRYVVLFFYPKDFTFVCPTEIIAFEHQLAEFTTRNCQVIGISVDDADTHVRWRNTAIADGGIGDIGYPLVADVTRSVATRYDVLTPDGEVALRGLFLIDKEGVVRNQVVNDLPLGRNVYETLRMLDALQFHEEHGEVCPANWNKGKSGLAPTAEGVASYLKDNVSDL